MSLSAAAATTSVYFLSAVLLLWAVHRGFRPVGRPAAILLTLLPLVITGRAVLTGRVLGPLDLHYTTPPFSEIAAEHGVDGVHAGILSDINGQNIPWRSAVRYCLQQGEWPLWNPFVRCGQPLAGAAQAAPYAPRELIGLLLPEDLATGFTASFTLLVAAIGAFLFARELGCRELAALVGAAAWMLSGFLTFWLPWTLGATVAWLPFLLAAVTATARCPGAGSAVWLTVVGIGIWTSGHPESSFHLGVLGGCWGLSELIVTHRRLRVIAWTAVAGAVAAGLSAVSLLPFLDTIDQTFERRLRQQHLSGSAVSVDLSEALKRSRIHLVPFAYGTPDGEIGEESQRPDRFTAWASGSVGSVLLAPALFGLGAGCRRHRLLLSGFVVFGVLSSGLFPLWADLLQRLPGFDLALNHRLVFAIPCGLSMLAALGIERWLARPRPVRMATLHGLAAAGLGLAVVAWWSSMQEAGLSAGFVYDRTAWLVLPVVFAAAISLVRRRTRLVAVGLLALVVVQRPAESGRVHPVFDREAYYPEVAPLDSIPRSDEPYRTVGVGWTLIPNAATVYQLEDPRGNEAISLASARRLVPLWSTPAHWFNRVHDLGRPLLDLMNVRYALAPAGHPEAAGWTEVARGHGVRLLENTQALPRAFLPREVVIGALPRRQIHGMKALRDPARRIWIEGSEQRHDVRVVRNPTGTVSTQRVGTGLRVTADLARAGWVMVTNSAWRGWRAFAGDQELEIRRANLAFLAIRVPAGCHRIRLVYRPRSFEVGLGMSGATAVALVLAGGASFLRRRHARMVVSSPGGTTA